MGKPYNFTKETVLAAIKDSASIMSTIAKRLGCTWDTANRFCRKWEETRQALENETETILDMAESTVFKNIKDGNSQDAKWLLSTKGKNRGYNERHEITGADGEAIKVTWQ